MNRIGMRTLVLCAIAITCMASSTMAQTVIRYVRLDQSLSFSQQTGQSWTAAFKYLQDAIDHAVAYHQEVGQEDDIVQIWVKGGTGTTFTYIPNVDGDFEHLDAQEEEFLLWNNTELYGGFDGTESSRGYPETYCVGSNISSHDDATHG